jgi:peptidoglycan biosynthesis protein MviN/MurJ (putative lipid II flippase)
MNDEEIKKIIESTYDDSREDTIRSIVSDFYSRKLLSTAILVWLWAMIFFAGAVYSAIQFFDVDDTKSQIMYAAIFVPCVICIGFMKVFAGGMVHRHSIKREIKRLELRIAELSEAVKSK